ncbi:MAG: hypothetical protein U5K28_07725 [Halobacteriales archaeon]|nr:hypothetical protein [Halobacteriales archaeon]
MHVNPRTSLTVAFPSTKPKNRLKYLLVNNIFEQCVTLRAEIEMSAFQSPAVFLFSLDCLSSESGPPFNRFVFF